MIASEIQWFIAMKITDLREDSVGCDGTRRVPTTVRK